MIAIRVGGQTLDLSLDAAIATNNRLSALYKQEPNPEKRRELIGILYQLNLPIFRKWRIYNFDEVQNYEQECFFWVARALDKFDASRGAFLPFLKKYFVTEAQRTYLDSQSKLKRTREAVTQEDETADDWTSDHLFWEEARTLLGEELYSLIHSCVFEGLTPTDFARKHGQPQRTVNYKFNQAKDILRTHIAKRSIKVKAVPDVVGEGEWVGPKKLCRILDITDRYLKDWINPNRPISVCPTYLDPRDIVRVQGIRIRYLFTPKDGLVFPRSIPKKRINFLPEEEA